VDFDLIKFKLTVSLAFKSSNFTANVDIISLLIVLSEGNSAVGLRDFMTLMKDGFWTSVNG